MSSLRMSRGLNIGSLRAKNLALLSKWFWRYKVEDMESLWGKVIRSIHGADGGMGWETGSSSRVGRARGYGVKS